MSSPIFPQVDPQTGALPAKTEARYAKPADLTSLATKVAVDTANATASAAQTAASAAQTAASSAQGAATTAGTTAAGAVTAATAAQQSAAATQAQLATKMDGSGRFRGVFQASGTPPTTGQPGDFYILLSSPITTLASEVFASPATAWSSQWVTAGLGTVAIEADKGTLTPPATAWAASPSAWLTGMTAVANFDLTVDVGFAGGLVQQYAAVSMSPANALRTSGDPLPMDGYSVLLIPNAGIFTVSRVNAGVVTDLAGSVAYTYTAGTRVNVQITKLGAVLNVWVWDVGAVKPVNPSSTVTDTAPLTAGMKVLLAGGNGSASIARVTSFDNLLIFGGATLATETWTGTSGAWPSQWTVAGPGSSNLTANTGLLTCAAGAYSAPQTAFLSGMTATANYVVRCSVGFSAGPVEQYVTIGASPAAATTSGRVPTDGYFISLNPGSASVTVNRAQAGAIGTISGTIAYTFTSGARVWAEIRRIGNFVAAWVWNVGTSRPTAPLWSGTDTVTLTGTSKAFLTVSNGANGAAAIATFDDLTVTGMDQLAAEDFASTTGAAWPSQWTTAAPGSATLGGGVGTITPPAGSFAFSGPAFLSGMTATSNFDLKVTVGFAVGLPQQYVTVGMAPDADPMTTTTLPLDGYGVTFAPAAGIAWVSRVVNGTETNLSSNLTFTFVSGVATIVEFLKSGSALSVWIWNVGGTKPASPSWSGTDASPITAALKAFLRAGNGNSTTAIPATFDDLTVATGA